MFRRIPKLHPSSITAVFLSALTNTLIYFLSVVTGITCFLVGCKIAGTLIFSLLALRVYLDLRAYKEFSKAIDQLTEVFASFSDGNFRSQFQ